MPRLTRCISTYVNLGIVNYLAKKLTKLDLWVVRIAVDSKGVVLLVESQPCASCMTTLRRYGLRKVWYSTAEGKVVGVRVRDLDDGYITRWNKHCDLHPDLRLN